MTPNGGNTRMTLNGSMEQFVGMQNRPETARAYRKDLVCWVTFAGASEASVDLVVAFKAWLQDNRAPSSAARIFTTVRTYMRWMVGQGRLDRSPFEWVKRPQRVTNTTPEVPTDNDVNGTLWAADGDSPKWGAVVALLLNGLRASEVADLTLNDILVDLDPDVVFVRVVGKGLKERLVPLTSEARQRLRRHISTMGSTLLLFTDVDGKPMTLRQVQHIVYTSAARARVENMHPHALRHHYATRLVRAGVGVLHLQQLLGHSRPETTQRYVTLDVADLIEAASKDPRHTIANRPALRAVS